MAVTELNPHTSAGPASVSEQSSGLNRALNSLQDSDRNTRLSGVRQFKQLLHGLGAEQGTVEHEEAWLKAQASVPALTAGVADISEGVREACAGLLAAIAEAAAAHDANIEPHTTIPSRLAEVSPGILIAAADRLGSSPPQESTEEVRRSLLRTVCCILALPTAPTNLAAALAARIGDLGRILEHSALDLFPEAKHLAADALLLAARPAMGLRLHLHAVMGRVCAAQARCCNHQRAAVRAAGARSLAVGLPLCGESQNKVAIEVVLPALLQLEGDRSQTVRIELVRSLADLLLGLGDGQLGLARALVEASVEPSSDRGRDGPEDELVGSKGAERQVPLRLLSLLVGMTCDPAITVAELARSRLEAVASAWAMEARPAKAEDPTSFSVGMGLSLPFPFGPTAGVQSKAEAVSAPYSPPSANLQRMVGIACGFLLQQAGIGLASWQADQRLSGARLLRVTLAVSSQNHLASRSGTAWDVLMHATDRGGELQVGPALRDAGALLGARCGEWVLLRRGATLLETGVEIASHHASQAARGVDSASQAQANASSAISGRQRGRAIRTIVWVLDGMSGRQAAPVLPRLAQALVAASIAESDTPLPDQGVLLVAGALAIIRAGCAAATEQAGNVTSSKATQGKHAMATEAATFADPADGGVASSADRPGVPLADFPAGVGSSGPQLAWNSAIEVASPADIERITTGIPLAANCVRLPLCQVLLPLLRPALPHPGARGGDAEGALAVSRTAAVCLGRLAIGTRLGKETPQTGSIARLLQDAADNIIQGAKAEAIGWTSPSATSFRGLAALLRAAPETVARPGAGYERQNALVATFLVALRATQPSVVRGAALALLFDLGDSLALAQAVAWSSDTVSRSSTQPVFHGAAEAACEGTDVHAAHADAREAALVALTQLRSRHAVADASGDALPSPVPGAALHGTQAVHVGDSSSSLGFGRWLGGQPLLVPPSAESAGRAAVALVPCALALVRDGLVPSAVWKPGQEAATLRRLALSATLRLVEAGILGPAGRTPLRGVLQNGCMAWPDWDPRREHEANDDGTIMVGTDDAGAPYIGGPSALAGHQAAAASVGVVCKVAGSSLDDEDGRTRKSAIRVMAACLRSAAAAGVRLTDESVRAVCHPLLQRLDDAHDDLRIDGACAAALLLRLAQPTAVRGQPVELTTDTLALHGDDPAEDVRKACEHGLKACARIDPEYVLKVCTACRARHRSPALCDRVVEECKRRNKV